MYYVYFVVSQAVGVFLFAVETAMLLRAILSWFPLEPNKFTNLLYVVTEPFIYPVRWFFQRMNWFQGSPLDVPFFVTFLLISVINLFL